MNINAWGVITTPSQNLDETFANEWEVLADGRLRIAELLPVCPESESISTIKNVATRIATRAHLMIHKGRWKRDIAIAKGFDDYYIRYGTGFFDGMILELTNRVKIRGNQNESPLTIFRIHCKRSIVTANESA